MEKKGKKRSKTASLKPSVVPDFKIAVGKEENSYEECQLVKTSRFAVAPNQLAEKTGTILFKRQNILTNNLFLYLEAVY